MIGNSWLEETELTDWVIDQLRRALPQDWTAEVADAALAPHLAIDGILTIAAPDGAAVNLALDVKRSKGASVKAIVLQAERLRSASRMDVVVIIEYANPALRAACAVRGLGYADTTGWVRLLSRKPGLFVNIQGAARPAAAGLTHRVSKVTHTTWNVEAPTPRGTAITRLSGAGAARIVRTLMAANPPVGVRELAAAAKVSPGSVSKVLSTLARAGAVERDKGAVVLIRRRLLLDRWTQDYSFVRSNRQVTWWLAPRGIERARSRLPRSLQVVATGSLVARRWLPAGVDSVTPLTLAALYAADTSEAAVALGLVPAAQGQANFVLAVPRDEELLSASAVDDSSLREVPLEQALADLLTLPGRSIEEADQVLEILSSNDPTWSRVGDSS